MNIIRMTGGLGNQMFQYALYLKLKSMGREVKLDDISEYHMENSRPIMLWAFGIDYPKADKQEINALTDGDMDFLSRIRRKVFGRKSLEYHEKDNNFDEQVLRKDPAYLTGYFQSEKYFESVKAQVREAFHFTEKIWQEISGEQEEIIKGYKKQIENTQSVAVHIRRGDYLQVSEVYGGICTEEYYRKAIALMKEKFPKTVFYIFSNDTDWAAEWAHKYSTEENPFVVIKGTTEETGYLDLLLMSRCKHYIIANSSFSWWGAWLGCSPDKCVVAPSVWLNGKECRDIYIDDMIRVSSIGEII